MRSYIEVEGIIIEDTRVDVAVVGMVDVDRIVRLVVDIIAFLVKNFFLWKLLKHFELKKFFPKKC